MAEKAKRPSLTSLVGQMVVPGDIIMNLPTDGQEVRLGGGLRQVGDHVISTRAGIVRHYQPGKYWIEGSQKRYVPAVEDSVIGIVSNRHGESFEVDIGAAAKAALPMLNFEGASRRNRPNIKVGQLVYARVETVHREVDPELSCVDTYGKSSGFGALNGGYMFNVTTGLARALLTVPTAPVLAALGKTLSYEIAVGINGRVWVNSTNVTTTILVSNAILNSEFLTSDQAEFMVQKLLERLKQTADA